MDKTQRVLLIVFGVVILAILVVLLSRCVGMGSDTPAPTPTLPSVIEGESAEETPLPTQESPVPTPAEEPVVLMPAMLSFQGPTMAQIGELKPVEVIIVSGDPLSNFQVEIQISPGQLQIEDYDAEVPGVQAMPAALPEGAQVQSNFVDETGLLTYRVAGLGDSVIPSTTLLLLPLKAVGTGVGTVSFEGATATNPEGQNISVQMSSPHQIDVQGEQVQPTPTTPPPTPTTPPETTPCPTADPTLCCLPCPPCQPPPSQPCAIQPGVYYRIQPGQNLFRLGKDFGTTAEAIATASGITDVRSISTGTLLRIPVTPPMGQAAYLVSTKETLFSIAQTFCFTVEDLATLNNIGPTQYGNIDVGQWLVLVP